MDSRRLSTGDILAMGIANRTSPKTDIPHDRETVSGSNDDDSFIGEEAVVVALDSGKLVESSNYYGIPHAWKESEGVYRGVLLQYRAVTEDKTFATATEAAEWFAEMHSATYG